MASVRFQQKTSMMSVEMMKMCMQKKVTIESHTQYQLFVKSRNGLHSSTIAAQFASHHLLSGG